MSGRKGKGPDLSGLILSEFSQYNTSEVLKEGDPQWDAMQQGYLDELAENFIFTNDFEKLREYVREGGDIDEHGFRDIVATMMEPDFKENATGNKDGEMISFYMAVRQTMKSMAKRNPSKKPSIRAATLKAGKDRKPRPLEEKAAENQYAQGKKRFIEKFKKPYLED